MNPPLMASRVVQQQQLDFCPDCACVHAPTLIVTGESDLDRIVPVEDTRRYLDLIPGSKYVRLERTRHLGLVTRPETFASVVGDFVHQQVAA
jgi:pimeloyl-ACP methyl ester carboxylesterase